MPNHCSQDLYVTGKPETLKKFMEFAEEGDMLLSANKFIPYPDKFKTLDKQAEEARKKDPNDWSVKDGFNSGGYDWCVNNWGTKWGMYNTSLTSDMPEKGKISYEFESAWAPATLIVLAMSKAFPSLHFKLKYFECGMGFKGVYVVQNGEVIEDVESKYSGSRGG